jgi:Flp pilus assembly protein TadG
MHLPARRTRTAPEPERTARGHRERERGAALVEFTLVLPLLLLVVFGGVTTAIAYERKSELVYAVRDGARYGATVPRDQCDTTSNCGNRNWAQLVQYVTSKRSDGALGTSDICVALVVGGTSSTAATVYTRTNGVYSTGTNATFPDTGCFDDGNADTGMRVHVSAVKNGQKINLIFKTLGVNLKSSASSRYEQ